VTVFLGSVEARFSVPAIFVAAVARSLGQDWPKAIGEAGAKALARAHSFVAVGHAQRIPHLT
jgi:hypothetical protein